jgi:olefin beta-lactone synthetase
MNPNVFTIFEESAIKYPNNIAIVEENHQITYSKLLQDIQQTEVLFERKGIQSGDRVLVFVPMSIDLYRIVLTLFKMGATAVFLDEWVSWKRMELCCQLADCKAFIGGWKVRFMAIFSGVLRKIPIKLGIDLPNSSIISTSIATQTVSQNQAALITFTTGSTGTPKAALRSHGFLREQYRALHEEINPQAGEMDMTVLPIVLLVNLGAGATSVIAKFKAAKPESMDAALIIRQLNEYQVLRITASPFFVRCLANYVLTNKAEVASLQQIFTGGAPVFPAEAAILTEAFPNADIKIAYGSTEAEPISLISAAIVGNDKGNNQLEGLPVGIPYHKSEVKIIEITDEIIEIKGINALKTCKIKEVGEIIVAGSHVLATYFNNPDALRRNKIFEGPKVWHRTGDSGFLDEDGQLFLTGRCNTIFEHQGKLVFPFLYESYLQQIEGVRMGTILKSENEVLFIVELSDVSKKETVTMELENLPISPISLRFLKKIPRDPRHNSKIDYGLLQKMLH